MASDPQSAEIGPDAQAWRKLELRMEHKPGRFVDVVLIRPLEWIEEEEAAVGEVIWLELPEMHAAGEAEVLAISACPALEPGSGPVITGTFRHEADELVELRVSGQPDPLRCTAEHPFWSATRHEFVAASALRPGEEIETATGTPALLTSITPRAGPETVYGLEVYAEHVYHVGPNGLLVHNASGGTRLPGKRYGDWEGERGNSLFQLNSKTAKSPNLSEGTTVSFRNGRVSFAEHSQGNYRVKGLSGNHDVDMPIIHQHIASKKGFLKADGSPNAAAAERWLSENGLTPHHAGGSKVTLVDSDLHRTIRHTGGAYDQRNKR